MKKSPLAKAEPRSAFAKLLRTARDTAGLTQAQAAERLQVARRAIQQWEAGERTPIYPAQCGALELLKK